MKRVILVLTLIASLFWPPTVAAQNTAVGVSVSPAIMKVDLALDPAEYPLTFTNTTEATVILTLHAQDFTQLEEGWNLKFLEGPESANYHYGLASWIDFSTASLTLGPQQSQAVMITIDNADLPAGGHYASILAEIQQVDAAGYVTLKGVLSSLLFVRAATGWERAEASVSALTPSQHWWGFPYHFVLRFQNSGNVELIPYGTLTVTDPLGRVVSKTAVNEASLITLPETLRRYELPTQPAGLLIPGWYQARLVTHFGPGQQVEYEQRFFSLGSFTLPRLGGVVLLLGTSVWLARKRDMLAKTLRMR